MSQTVHAVPSTSGKPAVGHLPAFPCRGLRSQSHDLRWLSTPPHSHPAAALHRGGRLGAIRSAAAAAVEAASSAAGGGRGGGTDVAPATKATDGLSHLLKGVRSCLDDWKPPKYLWRTMAALVLGGEVIVRILQGGWDVEGGRRVRGERVHVDGQWAGQQLGTGRAAAAADWVRSSAGPQPMPCLPAELASAGSAPTLRPRAHSAPAPSPQLSRSHQTRFPARHPRRPRNCDALVAPT